MDNELIMKQRKKCLLALLLLIVCVCKVFAQPTTEAEGKEMAQKLMHMTPAQIMKFRDSMMKAVLQKQAKVLPNGNQLLIQHHYDTTYTTVHFMYTRKVSESLHGTAGQSIYMCFGKSQKAPVMYEANGHTIVQCGMNPPGANTANMDEMAKKINKDKKYMTTGQAVAATDVARQMAFSSMTINDNSLSGTGSVNSLYNGHGGNTIISTKSPTINMGFSFEYDPVQVLSTVGVGATIHVHTLSRDDKGHSNTTEGTMGVGMSSATDPHFAKIVGVSTPPALNPDNAYIKVTKTSRGFKIEYTKTQYLREQNANIMETLTADIGEPDQQ
jgi:hypothetical protein